MASYLLVIALLVHAGLQPSNGQGPGLFLGTTTRLPNVTLLEVTSELQQIDCNSQSHLPVGQWHYPNGDVIPEGNSPPVYAVYRAVAKRAELTVHGSLYQEGIYTCVIKDNGVIHSTYFVGLYNSISEGQPRVSSVSLTVVDSAAVLFTLNCPSSSFPPTTVTWLHNGSVFSEGRSFQVLRDAPTTQFDNILEVPRPIRGTFTCQVGNTEGVSTSSITLQVPHRPDVQLIPIGDNKVRVQWAPLLYASQYVVHYSTSTTTEEAVMIDDGSNNSVTLEDIAVGVSYSVTVQAIGDIPGPISNVLSITLTAPPPPSSVVIVSHTSTILSLSWEQVSSDDVLGYMVMYTPVNSSCGGVLGGRDFITEGGTTVYTLTGLQEYINYSIVIQTKGSQGYGEKSTSVYERTLPAVPDPPVLQSAHSYGSHTLIISWRGLDCKNINSDNVDKYIVRYSSADIGEVEIIVNASVNSTSITTPMFKPFTEYDLAVAARSSVGVGNYSSPMVAVILIGPDQVTGLRATPDVTSLHLSWGPPTGDGSGNYVTGYLITYRLWRARNPLARVTLGRDANAYQVEGLLPNLTYEVRVQAVVQAMTGEVVTIVVATRPIGRVEGVQVHMLSPTSVNVSWIPLNSDDISMYMVDYFLKLEPVGVAGRAEFPGNTSWGVIGGLQDGQEYEFQVTAAVRISGVLTEGEFKSVITVESAVALLSAGGGLSDSAIAGIVVALVIACVCAVVLVLVALKLWHRERRGKFVIRRRRTYDQQPDRPTSIVLPLPDFEPFTPMAKPVVTQRPSDMTALEGEIVRLQPIVTGTPPPTIAWYYDGQLMISDYATELSEDGTLTFVCVETKHSGTYRYTVSNNAGSLQGQVQLTVVTEDQQVVESCTDQVESSRIRVEEFGTYCESLHDSNDKGFREQFYKLPSGEDVHSAKWGQHPEHRSRNRFTNIVVYDDNRVKLKPIPGLPDYQHDYVNASPINGYFMGKKFVTTQGPTENTVVDFWRMVWQLRTPTIVMITNLIEKGKSKCVRYWPEGAQEDYGPFRVVVSGEKVYSNYTIRSFHVNFTQKQQSPLKVVQYQFTSWPDHGVPEYVGPMLSFHRRIKAEHLSMLGPILVHCSAGVGRSGTYIAIDIALQQASGEGYMDIPATITGLRNQRMKMVQTQEQYTFVHDAVLESLVCGNTQIFIHEMQQAMENLQRWDSKTGSSGFQTQFQALEQMSPKLSGVVSSVGEKHKEKNRPDVLLPSDLHRVVLRAEQPDYINATFVHGYKHRNKYIITQGPLEQTSRDFWKMVYERNATCIVMLSGMIEDEEEVCHKYWPTRSIESYGEYSVSLLEQSMHDSYLERIYSITDSKSGQAHRVTQYQVINWDKYGIMLNRMAVLTVIAAASTRQKANQLGPIVLHCSDTITRSAIFCAISNVMDCCRIEGVVDVFQAVKILRTQRPGAIPTVEQYQIVHDFVLYFIQNMLPC